MKNQKNNPNNSYRFSAIGDSALLVVLDAEISLEANNQVRALDAILKRNALKGLLEWVPGYASMLVHYDPMVLDSERVKDHVLACLNAQEQFAMPDPQQIRIPVRYGGENGPDLEALAEYHGLAPSEVVRLHTKQIYRVGMMGFTPGFAYLMGLDPGLATPRRESPRTHVPAGSVGIAGPQTGIYPLESPGGWQLIGKTEELLYDPENERPFLLSPGDEVRFVPLQGGVLP